MPTNPMEAVCLVVAGSKPVNPTEVFLLPSHRRRSCMAVLDLLPAAGYNGKTILNFFFSASGHALDALDTEFKSTSGAELLAGGAGALRRRRRRRRRRSRIPRIMSRQ